MIKRRHILLLVSLTALLGGFVAIAATFVERETQLRGYVDATRTTELPYRVPLLGVNAELTQYSPSELQTQFNLMEQAHVTWIRQIARWDLIEPSQGEFDWSVWDTITQAAAERTSLKLIAVLTNSPRWARDENIQSNYNAPPANPEAFERFASQFAERYADIVDIYQIWDEPNLISGWGGIYPNSVDYLAILSSAYRGIHAVDPVAQVISAGLAPTTESGPQNISDIVYLRQLYALGLKDTVDAVAAKPFGFSTSPILDRVVDNQILNFSRLTALREIMLEAGDGKKALWASGWGWNSLPDTWTGTPSIWREVTQEEQSQYTIEAIDRASREWPWIGGMILHHWQPDAPDTDPVWGFAVVGSNNEPLPLWQSLASRVIPSVAENGIYPAANPYAQYSGSWSFGELGADLRNVFNLPSDNHVSFTFIGQDISLILRQGDYVGYLYPTIDAQPANVPPRDASGNPYILLTSDTREPTIALTDVARGLSNDVHTLQMHADRGSNQWALAGFAVSEGNLSEPYNRQIGVAGAATAVAVLSFIIAIRQINFYDLLKPVSNFWQKLSGISQIAVSIVTSLALMIGMMLTWSDGYPRIFRSEPVVLIAALISAGLLYLQPWFVITIIATALLFVIFYNRPDFGLMFTLFAAPFFLFPLGIYRYAFPMSEVFVLLTASSWVIRQLALWGKLRQVGIQNIQMNLRGLDYGVAAWALLSIASLVWSQYSGIAVTDLRVMTIEPVLFYMILRSLSDRDKLHSHLFDTLLLSGVVVAIIGLWLFSLGESVITAEEGTLRLASVYGSPNNVALFLGRCIPVALASFLVDLGTLRRTLSAAALLVMAVAAALTQSVGALFIGIPVSVAVVTLLSLHKRALPFLVGGFALASGAFAFASQSERFARALDFSSGTNFYRIRVWQSALNIIRDHPLLGIGPDQFLYAFRGRYIMPDAWPEPNLSHPHNIFLDLWVRLGIGGVLVLIWIQTVFWHVVINDYRRLINVRGRELTLCIATVGCMANLLSHGLIDNSIYVQDLTYVFVLLLAVTANRSNTSAIDEMSRKMV